MIIGHVYAEHAIPEGCAAFEQKYCEVCGRPFTRLFAPTVPLETVSYSHHGVVGESALRKDHGQRFCKGCRGRHLQPDIEAQEKYMAQLPGTAQQMRHAPHLPKYDHTLEPVGCETSAHKVSAIPVRRRKSRVDYDWRSLVRAAFSAKPRMTAEDICEIMPDVYTPQQAYQRCWAGGVKLRVVAHIHREGVRGSGPAVYELAEEGKVTPFETTSKVLMSDDQVKDCLADFFGA